MSAFRVLVLCTGNSARSQIAEALLTTRGAQRKRGVVTAASAGSHPAPRVNPFAIEVLALHGITWGDRTPTSIDALAAERFDLVITVCDNARDACPIFPGADVQIHWGLPDPAEEQDPETAREAFEATYRALDARITGLLALPLGELSAGELRTAATAIHAASPEPDW